MMVICGLGWCSVMLDMVEFDFVGWVVMGDDC